jgi:AAA domain
MGGRTVSTCPPKRRPPAPPGMQPVWNGEYWVLDDWKPDGNVGTGDLLEKLNARIFSPAKKPDEPKARFSLAGVPICTPGNLTTFAAQPKAGKTAATGAMMASAFGLDGNDYLGFRSGNQDGHAIVHFDTEQSTFDHWQIVDRARRRASVKIPEWLRSYCVTGWPAKDIRAALPLALAEAAQKFGGVHSMILDGAADAVADVNSAEESNEFVAELHALAIRYDCPIVCVIHLNPGSDTKTRGHLGSQLERKAETNLRLEKDDDEISTIWADKNRRKSIPKKTAPCFAWDENEHMHISVDNPATAKAEAKSEARHATMLQDAQMIFAHGECSFGDAIAAIEKKFVLERGGARRRLEEWEKAGIVTRPSRGQYALKP